MSNCKIEASAKRLLQYYPDDLEESMSEEMINYFSTLIKQHHFNSECKEIQLFGFINENKFMHTFPNVLVVFRLYLCLMVFNCSGKRSFSIQKQGKKSTAFVYGSEKVKFLSFTLH